MDIYIVVNFHLGKLTILMALGTQHYSMCVCVTKIVVSLNLPSNFLYLSLSANNVIMILHRRFGSTLTSKMFIGNQKNPLSAKVIEEKFY